MIAAMDHSLCRSMLIINLAKANLDKANLDKANLANSRPFSQIELPAAGGRDIPPA
jgi:uncharacterized protein YjbI with pentapeptide repeats